MPIRHEPAKLQASGNIDESVSKYLKAIIKQGDRYVVGLIGEGSSLELQANWDSPFEQDNAGSFLEKVGGLVQNAYGVTSKTTLNSTQVWNGNRPITISLILNFYALSNPKIEVEDALLLLKEFMSPEVNSVFPVSVDIAAKAVTGMFGLGRIPGTISLSIGRNFLYNDMLIESISEPYDVTRDKNGHRLRATVSVMCQSKQMINRSEFAGIST